jgi:hypothetical protein
MQPAIATAVYTDPSDVEIARRIEADRAPSQTQANRFRAGGRVRFCGRRCDRIVARVLSRLADRINVRCPIVSDSYSEEQ